MVRYEGLSDKTIVRKAVSGDREAFAELYRRFRMPVFAFIRARAKGTALADDVFQETFLSAFRSLGTYRGESSVFSWLCAIARRKLADALKDPARTEIPLEGLYVESRPGAGEIDESLSTWEALGALKSKYRQVLVLRYIDGLSVGDVAERMGCSYKAAESLLGRAKKALRKILEQRDKEVW